jgi:hypothetical protein
MDRTTKTLKHTRRVILFLASFGFALPLAAAPNIGVKCGANQERVWVYDNLTTWDVSARLKCGTTVDVLGLERGYVKIRTSDGTEGFVAPESIPSTEVAALTAAAAPAPTPASTSIAVRVQQPVAAAPVSAPAPIAAAPMQIVPTQTMQQAVPVAITASVIPAPQNMPALPAAQPKPAPVYVAASTQAPVVAAKPSVPQAIAAPSVTTRSASVATVASTSVPAIPAPSPVEAVHTAAPSHPSREEAMLVIEPAVTPAVSVSSDSTAKVVRAADFTPVPKHSMPSVASRTPEFSDDDDTADLEVPGNPFASCSVYFSAYGVTPMQYKWISGDLRKRYPGVCPAPEPSMVDYVVILTHDMNFFTTTLPDPIHTDRNGFSDWSPVTTVDDAQISSASLDKAHREYAWVFRVHRGTFNPADFTSRRKPQFTKTESKSSKSIEDAMEFIAGNGSGQ